MRNFRIDNVNRANDLVWADADVNRMGSSLPSRLRLEAEHLMRSLSWLYASFTRKAIAGTTGAATGCTPPTGYPTSQTWVAQGAVSAATAYIG